MAIGGLVISRQRVIVLAVVFLSLFGVIAQLAWTTASDTTGPWFSAALSAQFYSTTLVGATVVAIGLAALTAYQTSAASRELRALELRIGMLRGGGVGGQTRLGSGSGIDVDRDIEDTLDEILGTVNEEGGSIVAVDRQPHDSLVNVTTAGQGVRQEVALREFSRARSALINSSSRLWTA
ncbi:MAG: hypothetical protein L3J78_04125, partial [Thermoplasmata archaeon]|nr:hypothetical protein [Thermoplasmata archaeon]